MMATKTTIAIIGAAGKEGSAIAKSLAKYPLRLLLMESNVETLQILNNISEDTSPSDLEVINCPKEACWEADIIVFAFAQPSELQLAPTISKYATGKVVINIIGANTELHQTELQLTLLNSKVVNVFNARFSDVGKFDLTDITIEGHDKDAVEIAMEVSKMAGLM